MELQPRTRIGILLATAAFGIVQMATDVLPLPAAVAVIVFGPAVAWGLRRERFAAFLRAAFGEIPGASRGSVAIPLAGFALLIVALAFLELRDPYYFTEDDNFTMGPVAIAAARGFMAGEFPTWNPYQFMGQPTSVQSMYGLTYPFTYAAFAAAHWLGRDELYVELLTIGHILAGYFAMYWAARTLKVRPLLAVAATLSFVLSGAALMIARNYATMAPLYLWMPLLIVAAERVRTAAGLKWAILTALAIGLFCHSGNGQMWVYGVLFFGLALLLNLESRAARWIGVAAIWALAVSLLLIVPQLWFLRTRTPEVPSDAGIGPFWLSLILPAPLTRGGHPQPFAIAWELMTPYYYAGTILTLCTLVALVLLLAIVLHNRRFAAAIAIARQNVWLLCAGVALWMAWGRDAALWNVLEHLPILGSMGGPWKLVVYVHLFSALAGALIVERLLRAYTPRRVEFAVVAGVLVLTAYGVHTTRGAFTDIADKPYPELPRELAALLYADPVPTRGRILSVAYTYFAEPGYVESLARNFASWYGLSNVHGYDRFVEASEANVREARQWELDPVAAARAYGVRWVILHRSALAWHRLREPFTWHPWLEDAHAEVIERVTPHATVRLRRPNIIVWELPGADALAFTASDRRPLAIELSQTGVAVDVTSAQGAVVVNYLNRPGIVARVDGAPVPHGEDRWGRIVVQMPADARLLEVRYAPPWGAAAVASAITLLAGIVAAFFARRI